MNHYDELRHLKSKIESAFPDLPYHLTFSGSSGKDWMFMREMSWINGPSEEEVMREIPELTKARQLMSKSQLKNKLVEFGIYADSVIPVGKSLRNNVPETAFPESGYFFEGKRNFFLFDFSKFGGIK